MMDQTRINYGIKKDYDPKIERLIIAGKGGSGKDYLKNLIIDQYPFLKYCTSHTTRPIRENEVHGVDYFYSTEDEFLKMISEGKFLEHTIFNQWMYGTSIEQFEKSKIFIMTPTGIKNLPPNLRKSSYILYMDIEESIRRERLMKRNDADGVERRLEADRKDFRDFKDFDGKITNPFVNLENLGESIFFQVITHSNFF